MREQQISDVTHEGLLQLLDYSADTGVFQWRVSPCNRVGIGRPAGNVSPKNGYRKIRLLGRYYLAHRLALFYVTGEWPPEQIDHVNGVKTDNRIANLRPATPSENGFNRRPQHNKSGIKGVCPVTIKNRWHYWAAHIGVRGEKINLGWFKTKEEAVAARRVAEEKYQGEFAWVARAREADQQVGSLASLSTNQPATKG